MEYLAPWPVVARLIGALRGASDIFVPLLRLFGALTAAHAGARRDAALVSATGFV